MNSGTKNKKQEAWHALEEHQQQVADLHLRDLFAGNVSRIRDFSLVLDDLLIDYSKHRATRDTMKLLMALAEAAELRERIQAMFSGETVNVSEGRAALHTALRTPEAAAFAPAGEHVLQQVHHELQRVQRLVAQLHNGELKGSTGKTITRVINIGIGGSDLGPRLVTEALMAYCKGGIEAGFVANLDAQDLYRVLENADPAGTLFIVTSKSFTTLETHANAVLAREWLQQNGCTGIDKHFIAVSSNLEATERFGIPADRVFRIWDWVGGRYSVWSAVGLPVAACIGMDRFMEFLGGAHAMDMHFHQAPLDANIPVILGMLDVWYNNFFGAETLAVVPYDQRLRLLPEYLSQLVMESNGKGVTRDNAPLDCKSSPIIWGSVGTNAQHAFFQLLHQGNRLVPVDFLLPGRSATGSKNHHKLVANGIAQSKALMLGRDNPGEPQRHFTGNRPSTTIFYRDLTPAVAGMLLSMYEHRTFVQACIWDINPFDQWGVELGKQLAGEIIDQMENGNNGDGHDASTAMLINHYLAGD